MPTMASTTPTSTFSFSSTGPCSMCSSRNMSISPFSPPGLMDLGGVQTVFPHGLGHGYALAVFIGLQLVFIELAAHCRAGKETAAEAGALLLRQGHELYGAFRHEALLVESAGGLQGGHHSGGSVKAAAGLHRVKMAAGH